MKNKHKVDKFSNEYIASDFNGNKAMQSISPNLTPESLRVKTYRWLHSPQVLESIVSKVQALDLTPDKIKALIYARLLTIVNSSDSKDSDSIGASTLLAKLNKLINDNVQATQVNVYQDIVKEMEQGTKGIDRI